MRPVLFLLALLFAASPVQARYRPDLDWRVIRTDNYTIYYPRGHEAFAGRVLGLSNQVHSDVTGFMEYNPKRVPVVLNPDTDLFNGFYAPLPNRISLYETPLWTVRGFGPASDEIHLVFTHEYTHYTHITTSLGWYRFLTKIMGDGLAITNGASPGWVVEGLTTNTETLFSDGGRGRDPQFLGRFLSMSEGKGLWGLAAASTASPYSPPANRIYGAGYFMIEYLTRTSGTDAAARLSRYQAEHPFSGARGALKAVTGLSPSKFYSNFRQDFGLRAEASLMRAAAERLPGGNVIVSWPLDSVYAHFWTERGTILALRTGYDQKTALVEIDPFYNAIMREQPTGKLDILGTVRLAPDGKLIYGRYFLHPLGGGDISVTDLSSFDPKTGKLKRLTRNEHIFNAGLSPDGTRFAATRRNGMGIDLVLVSADGDSVRTLVSRPDVFWDAPCWSPDGTVIAAVCKQGRNADIVLADPATGDVRFLFQPDEYDDNEPSFSPDGRWIVFSSNRSGALNIFAWDRRDERLYQLTSVPFAAGDPQVSPDGRYISFTRVSRDIDQLCFLPFDTASMRPAEAAAGGLLADIPESFRGEETFQGGGIPFLEAYRPYLHIPWAGSDEDGAILGLTLMGGDPLGRNAYQASLTWNTGVKRFGYDIQLVNQSFWPTLTFRAYDSTNEGNTLGGKGFRLREHGGEVSAGLDIINRTAPDVIQTEVSLGARYRAFHGLEGVLVDPAHDRSVSLFGAAGITRIPDAAPRDLIPGWGESAQLLHEQSISALGSELSGQNTVLYIRQYAPSPVRHQGFAFTAVFQRQEGPLRYGKDLSIPRGYDKDDPAGGLNLGKNIRLSADYQFPLKYVDTGIGLILWHLYLVKGSVFVDSGAGWRGQLDLTELSRRARVSIGGTFTFQGSMMLIPSETGISAGYRTRERDWFTEFLFQVNL